ncbi:hypothetical protein CEXT_676931 [Caerostris extrusa]|uniref:Uncharacterized protein n=1 Tax=Caerostris extrusa TaxID=172846 RepID=A0AAV4PYN5_CAEEX|nr:hypothetical protein CEXT_676931 [Caerostris extrusa]
MPEISDDGFSSSNALMYIARRINCRYDTEEQKTSLSAPNATLTFIRFPRLMMLRSSGLLETGKSFGIFAKTTPSQLNRHQL